MLHQVTFSHVHLNPVYGMGGATAVKAQRYSLEACRLPGGRLPEVVCLGCLDFRHSRGGALTKKELWGMPWGFGEGTHDSRTTVCGGKVALLVTGR